MSETQRAFVLGKVTLIRPDDSAVWSNVEIPVMAVQALSVDALCARYVVPAALTVLQQLKETTR